MKFKRESKTDIFKKEFAEKIEKRSKKVRALKKLTPYFKICSTYKTIEQTKKMPDDIEIRKAYYLITEIENFIAIEQQFKKV
jgi:hypothetical protein